MRLIRQAVVDVAIPTEESETRMLIVHSATGAFIVLCRIKRPAMLTEIGHGIVTVHLKGFATLLAMPCLEIEPFPSGLDHHIALGPLTSGFRAIEILWMCVLIYFVDFSAMGAGVCWQCASVLIS